MLTLNLAHPDLPDLITRAIKSDARKGRRDGLGTAEFVEVTLPGLDRPGLLHVPTLRVIPPLSGADDADDTDDDDDKDAGADKGGKGKSDDTDDDPDDDDKDDDDLAAARKAAAAANRELRKLKADSAKAAAKAKAEAGQYKELYEEEKAKAEALEKAAEDGARTRLAEAALAKLNSKNPGRYVRLLELDDIDDEASADRAARKLLKTDPDLFKKSTTRVKRGAGKVDDDDDDDTEDDKKPKQKVNRLRRGLEATPK